MASQAINHTSGTGDQTTTPITVGSGEKVAVRLTRFDTGTRARLKISGNGVVSYEELTMKNTLFDAIASGHEVSVVTNPQNSGGVEGMIETYA